MDHAGTSRKYADFTGTAAGTNAGVTLTVADPGDGKRIRCSGIQGSGDAAALVTVESPSGTVLWRKRYDDAFNSLNETFDPPLKGASSEALLVKISASTSNSEINAQGWVEAG